MKNKLIIGNISGILGYFMWGVLPLFWKLFGGVAAAELIVFRILSSAVLLLIVISIKNKSAIKTMFSHKKQAVWLAIAAIFLGANWTIYIFAVVSNNVMQCSLGYYINPLINIVLGGLFLHESFNKTKILAVVLATIGVANLVFNYGQVPYYALGVALSFGIYGLIKKQVKQPPLQSLFYEMVVLTPIAIAVQLMIIKSQVSIFNTQPVSLTWIILILLSGVATMAPLAFYNIGVNYLTMGNMGFLQFLAPTLMFIISVTVNGEAFTTMHLISFMFIWSAEVVYCINLIKQSK